MFFLIYTCIYSIYICLLLNNLTRGSLTVAKDVLVPTCPLGGVGVDIDKYIVHGSSCVNIV